jgi:hypothetical protein
MNRCLKFLRIAYINETSDICQKAESEKAYAFLPLIIAPAGMSTGIKLNLATLKKLAVSKAFPKISKCDDGKPKSQSCW